MVLRRLRILAKIGPMIPRPSQRRVLSLSVLKEVPKPRRVQELPVQEVLLPNPRREHIVYSQRQKRTIEVHGPVVVAMPKHRRVNQDQPDQNGDAKAK